MDTIKYPNPGIYSGSGNVLIATDEEFSSSDPLSYGYHPTMRITSDDLAEAAEIGDSRFASEVVTHWDGATTEALVLAALAAARA